MTSYGIFFLALVTSTCLSSPQYGDPTGAQGVPLGGVPLGGVPLGGVPLGGVPLGGVPLGGVPTSLPTDCGNPSYECVPHFQCIDGVINTDGSGLIDPRIKPQEVCSNPDYPDVPAVCCLIPGESVCPQYQECVDYSLCTAQGTINTDGSGLLDSRISPTSCYLDNGNKGICCSPPLPHVESCPSNSVCSLSLDCYGEALDDSNNFINYVSTGLWTSCSYGSIHGVCCIPPHLDNCPSDSVCTLGSSCTGRALDAGNNFIDYVTTGLWTSCSYDSSHGICCIPPHLDNCPSGSVCTLGSDCTGRALDAGNNFIDYVTTGLWTSCSYDSAHGICCIPPHIDNCPSGSVCTLGSDCTGRALDAGNNFIDYVTTGLWTSCSYDSAHGICCILPHLDNCPSGSVCTLGSDCSGRALDAGDNFIDYVTTGLWTSCSYDSALGVCCIPPHFDNCPSGSVCTLGTDCTGRALDAGNNFIDYVTPGLWTSCSYDSAHGVCCIAPPPIIIDTCPKDSICLPSTQCVGTALDDSNNFVDYVFTGTWTHCSGYDKGVCCINPVVPYPDPADTCGVRNAQIDQRISSQGYNEAGFGEFPWQAIIFYQNYTYVCGATLISNKHLLTAAHCVNNLQAGDIRVRLGEWQVNSFDETLPYKDRNVHSLYINEKFNSKNLHNDIAIIELVKPLKKFKYHINTLCLPDAGVVFDHYNERCFATGWGKESFTGNFQHILKKVDLPYVDHSTCQNLLRKTRLGKYFRLSKSFVCAGGEENKDACYGDGGGPLVCLDTVTSRYVLAGITSWGIGCGSVNVPGVYVNVEQFRGWIDGIVNPTKGPAVPGYGK